MTHLNTLLYINNVSVTNINSSLISVPLILYPHRILTQTCETGIKHVLPTTTNTIN